MNEATFVCPDGAPGSSLPVLQCSITLDVVNVNVDHEDEEEEAKEEKEEEEEDNDDVEYLPPSLTSLAGPAT